MGWLDTTMVHLLATTAVNVPLGRNVLWAGISELTRAQTRPGDNDLEQMILDVTFLNRTDLPLRERHLRQWLQNAIAATGEMTESNVFKTALVQLDLAARDAKLEKTQSVSKSAPAAPPPAAPNPAAHAGMPRTIVFFTAADGSEYVNTLTTHMHGLKKAKLATFVRTDNLPSTEDYMDSLRQTLRDADVIVGVVTPQLLTKDDELAELAAVGALKKPIVPLLAMPVALEGSPFAGKNTLPRSNTAPPEVVQKLRGKDLTLSHLTGSALDAACVAITAEMRALLQRLG